MLPNLLNFFSVFLGVMTLVRIVNAVEHPWSTFVRRAIVFPGPQLGTVKGPMTGTECINHCLEVKKCMVMITQPVSWDAWDQLNKNKDLSFVKKYRRTQLSICMLFENYQEGKANRWVGRGVSVSRDGIWKAGNLLIVEIIFQENGVFDPNDFTAPPDSGDLHYTNEDFRMEMLNQATPTCSATPTISSFVTEKQPTSTPRDEGQSSATPTDANSASPDPAVGTQGTSPRTNPLTSSTPVKPTREDGSTSLKDETSTMVAETTTSTAEEPVAATRAGDKEGYSNKPNETTPRKEERSTPEEDSSTSEEAAATTPTTFDDTNTVPLISYTCYGSMVFGFKIICKLPYSNVSEVFLAASPSAEEGCTLYPVRYSLKKTKLVNATATTADAYCSFQPCGRIRVPIGITNVMVPSLNNAYYDIYAEVAGSQFCFAYRAISHL